MTPRHPNARASAEVPAELRRAPLPDDVRRWIERVGSSTISAVRRLTGATSSALYGVVLGNGQKIAVRRYCWPRFLEEDPVAPRREVDALAFAVAHGLRAPELIAAEVDGSAFADGVPVVAMAFRRGRPHACPDLAALALAAATIHDLDPSPFGHVYAPWYQDAWSGPPDVAVDRALWERAFTVWRDGRPAYRPAFIHRDFHPGNVLWRRGSVEAVVDWPNACAGPRGADVAHCRRNLIRLCGRDAADAFVAQYSAITGVPHDRYWDLAALLERSPSVWDGPTTASVADELASLVAEIDR